MFFFLIDLFIMKFLILMNGKITAFLCDGNYVKKKMDLGIGAIQ